MGSILKYLSLIELLFNFLLIYIVIRAVTYLWMYFMLSLIQDFFWCSDIEMPESIVECVNVFRVFCQIKSDGEKRPGKNRRNRTWPSSSSDDIHHGKWPNVFFFSIFSSVFTWPVWSKTSSTLALHKQPCYFSKKHFRYVR